MTIATGYCKESDVFLPRIPLIPSGANIPFEFKRLQFPVIKSLFCHVDQQGPGPKLDSGRSLFTSTLFHMGSTMLGAHGLACQVICSFVHLVVRLGISVVRKLVQVTPACITLTDNM